MSRTAGFSARGAVAQLIRRSASTGRTKNKPSAAAFRTCHMVNQHHLEPDRGHGNHHGREETDAAASGTAGRSPGDGSRPVDRDGCKRGPPAGVYGYCWSGNGIGAPAPRTSATYAAIVSDDQDGVAERNRKGYAYEKRSWSRLSDPAESKRNATTASAGIITRSSATRVRIMVRRSAESRPSAEADDPPT